MRGAGRPRQDCQRTNQHEQRKTAQNRLGRSSSPASTPLTHICCLRQKPQDLGYEIAAAEAEISTSALKLIDSPSGMMPVLYVDRLVGQALSETDRSKLHGLDRLPGRHAATPDELDAAASQEGLQVQSGDAVLVRTGWYKSFAEGESGYGGRLPRC